jgi:PAS domain S-box-containing protein
MYRIHGLRPEEFAVTLDGQLGLVHDDDRSAVTALLDAALAGQRPAGLDHRVRSGDGQVRWVFTAAAPVTDAAARVLGISGVCQDITTRMASEAALREALARERAVSDELRRVDRLKDEFLATVSHELRTPLTSIAGFASLLIELAPEHADMVGRIERNAREMQRLIQGLLDQARLESGRVVLEPRRLVLAEALRDVLGQYEAVVGDTEVSLDVDERVAVVMDAQAFERVVGNLLGNAAKYAPGSPIEISVSCDDATVTLAVTDHGPGIPAEHQARLFEPYYRAPGAGRAIVRRYAELHGGRAWCRSAPGRGSTFLVTMPRAADEPG